MLLRGGEQFFYRDPLVPGGGNLHGEAGGQRR